jgi:hypothetical protein
MMRADGHQASTSTVERALAPPWAAAAGGDRGIVDELPGSHARPEHLVDQPARLSKPTTLRHFHGHL